MLIYDDETRFGTNEKGDAIVFDWAHECGFYSEIPGVEALRTYVERTWKLNWLNKKADQKAKFDVEKHAVSANSAAQDHITRLQGLRD